MTPSERLKEIQDPDYDMCRKCHEDVEWLISRINLLTDGLLEYGGHKIGCRAPDGEEGEDIPCTCGFSSVLRGDE